MNHIQSQGLGKARTHGHADSQQTGQDVGQLPSFDEAEDDAPHASQGQSIEEQRVDVGWTGQASEGNQGEFGQGHRGDDELQPILTLQFRDESDGKELGYQITGNLHQGGRYLVVDSPAGEPVEGSCRKGLAQGIDQRVGEQGSASSPEDEEEVAQRTCGSFRRGGLLPLTGRAGREGQHRMICVWLCIHTFVHNQSCG